MVDDNAYRLGARVIRGALGVGAIARAGDLLARVWQRYAKTLSFLRRGGFDGVVDGGANVGEFAHLVAMALPRADLVCVEPHPACASTLRREGFRLVEAALWREAGEITLRQPTSASTSSTVLDGPDAHGTWRVKATRLDALDVRGDRVLVKLDLQGAEPEALDGMDALWPRCAGLILEVSYGPEGSYEPLRARLGAHGYREVSTLNELEIDGRVVEADKAWLRSDIF